VKLFGLQQQLSRSTDLTTHTSEAIFTIKAVFAPKLNFYYYHSRLWSPKYRKTKAREIKLERAKIYEVFGHISPYSILCEFLNFCEKIIFCATLVYPVK